MPLVGLGTWEYNDTVAGAAVESAFKLGYRHVDTALTYGNQRGVGQALHATGLARQEYFITSKIPGATTTDAKDTIAALEKCLSLLDTPYRAALSMVDSYLSYVIPEPDFNQLVSLLSDRDGDHYEDTVSPSHEFASHWQEAQLRMADRARSPQ